MRRIYNALFYLLLPLVLARLIWRSFKQVRYLNRLPERFGFYSLELSGCIWVHAVSVGEVLAALPLIKQLKQTYPQIPLLITTMTPTGSERVKMAFGDSVHHVFIPYDFSGAVQRFLAKVKPIIAVILETELWPNLIYYTAKLNIPICLSNARLSEKSARGYARISRLTQQMLSQITVIAAHGEQDAARFIRLGAPSTRVKITGNVKFDLQLPDNLPEKIFALRQQLNGNLRFIWIAASTHEGEEEIILAAHQQLRTIDPSALLMLVPRHPERFEAIYKLAHQRFLTSKRTEPHAFSANTAVYVGDTMGELLLLYGASDVAFIGGSLIARGGHNMLEAAALAKPLITGPSLFNFAEISEKFINADALTQVTDDKSLAQCLIELRQNEQKRVAMGNKALKVVENNRGALAKQLAIITSLFG